MKKLIILLGCVLIVVGCASRSYVDTRSWDQLTPGEQQEYQRLADIVAGCNNTTWDSQSWREYVNQRFPVPETRSYNPLWYYDGRNRALSEALDDSQTRHNQQQILENQQKILDRSGRPLRSWEPGYNHPNQGYTPNQYGLGVHSDNYGRPFQWETQQGETVPGFIKVEPDGYGPGISKDQFGRPVTRKPFGGSINLGD